MMKDIIQKLAAQSESFYLYDEGGIKGQLRKLKDAFQDVKFLYSVKCNPNEGVLRTVFSCGLGADAAALSPAQFSSHTPPDEYLLRENGEIEKYGFAGLHFPRRRDIIAAASESK